MLFIHNLTKFKFTLRIFSKRFLIKATLYFTYADEDHEDDVEDMNNNNKFIVMGHRGSGMNMLQYSSSDNKTSKVIIKENTLLSFNEAAKFNPKFIEFDVQVRQQISETLFFF